LSTLPSTGFAGVLAWTTDTNEIYVDTGSGTGIPAAWSRLANDVKVFTAADQTSRLALTGVLIGDLCLQADNNRTYILTDEPASNNVNWTAIGVTSGTTIQGLSAPVTHQFVTYIDNNGVQHLAQPSFADISGLLAQTQLPTSIGAGSSLTNIDCGSF
jgi:hypothetical protein